VELVESGTLLEREQTRVKYWTIFFSNPAFSHDLYEYEYECIWV